MRIGHNARLLAASLLGVVVVVLAALGCGGSPSTTSPGTAATTAKPVPATTTTTKLVVLDVLSTFDAKDPFIQQAVSTTAGTTGTTRAGTTGTTRAGTTSTTRAGTTSTTRAGSTTSTTGTSGVHHSMKALSISTSNGVTTATVEVDDVVFQNKKVNDVLSTGWGQVKITRIDVTAQSVTVLHGSESRVLYVGQEIIK